MAVAFSRVVVTAADPVASNHSDESNFVEYAFAREAVIKIGHLYEGEETARVRD